jgi:hypothetical protein
MLSHFLHYPHVIMITDNEKHRRRTLNIHFCIIFFQCFPTCVLVPRILIQWRDIGERSLDGRRGPQEV